MTFTIELEREMDGRWVADVPALPGVMCYGIDREEAIAKVQALALRVVAERLEHRETPAEYVNVTFWTSYAHTYRQADRPDAERSVISMA